MKITAVGAAAYTVPVELPVTGAKVHFPFALVSIDTDTGLSGHGISSLLAAAPAAATLINHVVGPSIVGMSPLDIEKIALHLALRFNGSNNNNNGFWGALFSGIDIALWDLKGKFLGHSVARLLGGARETVPAYVTFGVSEYSLDELVAAAKGVIAAGHTRVKMVVGGARHPSLATDRSGEQSEDDRSIEADAARVHAVRLAVGPDVEIMIDANCRFSTREALRLINRLDGANVRFFEEPLRGNDWQELRWLRDRSAIELAAGQFLPDSWAHRDLIANGSIDISQPNVCACGGYTESVKVAAIARAFNVALCNGGGWPHHNLHLQAGMPNGSYVEYHWLMWNAGNAIFQDPPSTAGGVATIPNKPGLGFEPRPLEEREQYRL